MIAGATTETAAIPCLATAEVGVRDISQHPAAVYEPAPRSPHPYLLSPEPAVFHAWCTHLWVIDDVAIPVLEECSRLVDGHLR
eukprot:scaffold133702_cov37-Tisochrysis_lutea.AAC.2